MAYIPTRVEIEFFRVPSPNPINQCMGLVIFSYAVRVNHGVEQMVSSTVVSLYYSEVSSTVVYHTTPR